MVVAVLNHRFDVATVGAVGLFDKDGVELRVGQARHVVGKTAPHG